MIFFCFCKRDKYSCNLYLTNSLNKEIFISLINENDTTYLKINKGSRYLIAGGENYLKYQPNEIFYLKFKQLILSIDSTNILINYESNISTNPFLNRSLWKYINNNIHPLGLKGKAIVLNYELSIDSLYLREICKQ